jgi:hypothetical protein
VKAVVQIFLSYAREDEEKVENLYQRLSDEGFKPWMDTKDILPGEKWPSSIRKAIRRSDFFLLCLSENSVDKRGWIQKEIREALENLQGMLDSDIYLVPVRLEKCEVPESLREFQWVDLFEEDGWTRLVEAVQEGMKRRLKQVPHRDSRDPDLAAKFAEVREKLREQEQARHRQNRGRWQRAIAIAWGTVGVIFAIAVAIFPGRFAAAGDTIEKWWREIRATPTPTVAIPGIARIEVFMNGGQLNLDQLPSLSSGQAVELEVIVFDTNGKRYAGDDLVCTWSVAPLGDGDLGIKTDLCKTFYAPSRQYSSQTVVVEIEGLEQQLEPGDPISMEFNINE